MTVQLINPDTLPNVPLYHQVAVATGSKTIYVAGQVARDADGAKVGEGDFAAQVERCFLNVGAALAAAGATFDDLVKLTMYVVGWGDDRLPQLIEGVGRAAAALGVTPSPPTTVIGVVFLAEPDIMVEVEAIAVID